MAVSHSEEIQNQIWDIKDELRKIDVGTASGNTNNSRKRRKELESALQ